jgi:hypothetical protein
MGEWGKISKKKSKFKKNSLKKIHVGIQYPEKMSQEERIYIISSDL